MPRLANPDDLTRLSDIVVAAYSIYLDRMDRPPAPMSHDLIPDVAAGRVWLIGEPAAGLICLVPGDGSLLIENVAVHPDAQGRGMGRRLIEFAETRARELELPSIRLYANEVMTENLALYSHLGFREVDRRTEHGFNRVFMEKRFLV
jgi:ribosomal protein S18 acetylase RimI-like enzyme